MESNEERLYLWFSYLDKYECDFLFVRKLQLFSSV